MSNIRHFKPSPAIKITVGEHRLRGLVDGEFDERVVESSEGPVPVDFSAAGVQGMETARQEDADRRSAARLAEPLDESMSAALQQVYAADMPGAEKLRAIQALQRVTTENHCAECGGDGWVVGVENADSGGGDPGNQCQIDCPSCTQF